MRRILVRVSRASILVLFALATLLSCPWYTFLVLYDGNGHTGGEPPVDPERYAAGETVTVAAPGTLEKAGHVFASWNTGSGGGGIDRPPGSTFVMESRNEMLYARWIPGGSTTTTSTTTPPVPPSLVNVIVMISDGCGFEHVTASSCFQHGTPAGQIYHSFPVRLAMSTWPYGGSYDPALAWANFSYVADDPDDPQDVTDSSAAATAMSTGTKTRAEDYVVPSAPARYLGVDHTGAAKEHICERFEARGRSTGVVTSMPWSHATPAGFVVHTTDREDYVNIARAMLDSPLEVIMGCGHPAYDHDGAYRAPAESNFKYVGGSDRWDSLNAGTLGGDCDGDGVPDPWTSIRAKEDFEGYCTGATPKRLVGTARVEETLQQRRSGTGFGNLLVTVPSIKTMALAALNVLDGNAKGFFLMAEAGGAVDWACHANQKERFLEEQKAFDETVKAVHDWIGERNLWDRTLLVVTADHETGYLTGPGSGPPATWNPVHNGGAGNIPGMAFHSYAHTNSLVPFYAKGAFAQDFTARATKNDSRRGKYLDNTDIAKVILARVP